MGASLVQGLEAIPGLEVRGDAPLAPLTSVRAGGSADALVRPRSPDALVALLRHLRAEGLPLTVLGGGANTLVGDGGVRGVTLRLPGDLFAEGVELGAEEGRLTLGAGAAIVRLPNLMRTHALVGAEFLAGIPGTLGGAVTMNAGTKNGEAFRVVEAVELATAEGVGWLPRERIPHAYRHTELPAGSVVTRVRFCLRRAGPEELAASKAAMEADLGYRKRTQPLSQPNFGSVFTNPTGDHAGRLIELAGLKGHVLGRAQVSTLHANWIVNLGGAAARDVLGLMMLMQTRVRELSGVELHPEVKRVGEFLP
ncbi:UDP-N-acetylmuramate dehydrogenase [Aggregicoccus sp. 17bor-14]|uniref:UDP-N-acetylmuramate dehydrogenase n=1 Tax=Myxococcaceae TaxID=31 RepID=UPI00129C7901|nr:MULTISPECIES: UDP-N-acetylmuramate dehydrogenase [Myxococcaceae]MBF5044415.1 UDP-N-acetylmuramate dehydrogenase [Simulacricoccus sp. 17bor-14]MRI90162.1 UDP-N-acetylmuramate dehydrogenase [Aggregicoccus sp. 17bor-14]